eukprot:4513907-Pyramimonas_sp.AAC.1
MGLERGLDPVTRGDAACRMNRVADEKEAKFREMAAKVLTPLEGTLAARSIHAITIQADLLDGAPHASSHSNH